MLRHSPVNELMTFVPDVLLFGSIHTNSRRSRRECKKNKKQKNRKLRVQVLGPCVFLERVKKKKQEFIV